MWNFSQAGVGGPLRYWAHVHFENDPLWGKETWTLFVELTEAPTTGRKKYDAKIFFMSPDAPHEFLRVGQKFTLGAGDRVMATGVVTALATDH